MRNFLLMVLQFLFSDRNVRAGNSRSVIELISFSFEREPKRKNHFAREREGMLIEGRHFKFSRKNVPIALSLLLICRKNRKNRGFFRSPILTIIGIFAMGWFTYVGRIINIVTFLAPKLILAPFSRNRS